QELLQLYEAKAISAMEIANITPRLKANVDQSAYTLNNLIFWANSQMKGIRARPKEINLSTAVSKCIKLFAEQLDRKNIHLQLDIEKNCTCKFDPDQMNIILRNLIYNAIKYSNTEGSIKINCVQNNADLILSICDDGIGMNQNQIDNILNAVEVQSTPGTYQEKGTGIGLSITMELIKLNDAYMTIESEENKGSCFNLHLPRV
ncbi:MAG: hypothetical protein HKO09_06415, partial [Croceitalea sp.]|nr:hypothetical protein [Croceitalea sp.]